MRTCTVDDPSLWGERATELARIACRELNAQVEVERAVHLLESTKTSVDRIAGEVGYADGVTLRTLLRRKLGRGVREIRHSVS